MIAYLGDGRSSDRVHHERDQPLLWGAGDTPVLGEMVHLYLARLRLYAARRNDGFHGVEPSHRRLSPRCDGATECLLAFLVSSKLDGGAP